MRAWWGVQQGVPLNDAIDRETVELFRSKEMLARVEALRRRLTGSGRLLGTCSPEIRFYALGKHVFCDKSTVRVDYSTTLEEFEALMRRGEIPGFRPA